MSADRAKRSARIGSQVNSRGVVDAKLSKTLGYTQIAFQNGRFLDRNSHIYLLMPVEHSAYVTALTSCTPSREGLIIFYSSHPPVSRAQRLELLTPVPSGCLEVADALGYQEPLDAARMLAAFVDEPSPFPAATAIVLLLEARHSHNSADPRARHVPAP
ncbi:hypothetical protein X768_23225 [Mesorhizobium sp. LSJC265A00]|nr:hypothetical protein X768_23225 [Mesorhizobium sp. LSJC265A00]